MGAAYAQRYSHFLRIASGRLLYAHPDRPTRRPQRSNDCFRAHHRRRTPGRVDSRRPANGFANRFLFVAVKRSKVLPFGGEEFDEGELQALVARLHERSELARTRGRITMTPAARAIWGAVYPELSEGSVGLHGSVTARAEAQCILLALVYALLDGADHLEGPHLQAALAVWTPTRRPSTSLGRASAIGLPTRYCGD